MEDEKIKSLDMVIIIHDNDNYMVQVIKEKINKNRVQLLCSLPINCSNKSIKIKILK